LVGSFTHETAGRRAVSAGTSRSAADEKKALDRSDRRLEAIPTKQTAPKKAVRFDR
jgi:hypothetical protein